MRVFASRKFRILALCSLLVGVTGYQLATSAGASNGFDLSNSILPANEIRHGGPPRDGIPALSDPEMLPNEAVDYIQPRDRIVGIEIDGQARAYPIDILNWHEIVNDSIGDSRFAITYCPLCGTAVAFDAEIDGEATDFGVSGLLYNSDVLLYDRATETLWSQIMTRAIAGPRVGQSLTKLPISHTTWQDWLARHPETLVLSRNTGHSRNYDRNPYAGYEKSRTLYFEVNNEAPDNYHPKEIVVGLGVDGVYKAYPFVELDRQGKASFSDEVNGKTFKFDWDSDHRSVRITDTDGREVAAIQGFWFAWFAFHPDTGVFKAGS